MWWAIADEGGGVILLFLILAAGIADGFNKRILIILKTLESQVIEKLVDDYNDPQEFTILLRLSLSSENIFESFLVL